MTITARYASTCTACHRAITIGQQIEWERGRKAVRHTDCAHTTPQIPRSESRREITVERIGRRSYLRGDTLAVRSYLRAQGCHWDAESRGWWIGDDDAAHRIAEAALSQAAEPLPLPKKRITHCIHCRGMLDQYQLHHGYRFCSSECAGQHRHRGQSYYDSHGRFVLGEED